MPDATLYLETPAQLHREIDGAEQDGLARTCHTAEQRAGLPAGVLLAIASREHHCVDGLGDGGHGRGVFQIDDRWHADWLAQHGAGRPGGIPPVAAAAALCASMIAANMKEARTNRVPERDVLAVALAAYNAGMAAALTGYREGDVDAHTASGNYSHDVLARRSYVERWGSTGASSTGKPPVHRTPARRSGQRYVIGPASLRDVAGLFVRTAEAYAAIGRGLLQLPLPAMPPDLVAEIDDVFARCNGMLLSLGEGLRADGNDLVHRAAIVDTPPQPIGVLRGRSSSGYPLVQVGGDGAAVRRLQRLLNRLGYGPLAVDGQFGPLTRQAVIAYQRRHGLTLDGQVGPRTWGLLLGTRRAPAPAPTRRPDPPPPAPNVEPPSGSSSLPDGSAGLEALAVARRNVGYMNGSSYDLPNKFSSADGRPAEAWCADFISFCFLKSGNGWGPGHDGSAGVEAWYQHFAANHELHQTPKVGAVVMFNWHDGGSEYDHIGIVSRVDSNGTVHYISGNTHDPAGSGQVGVFEKTTPPGTVLAYGY